ncbi:MAG: VWA domain-containing protein, partial [Thermoanaerobaculia bacterium]
GLTREDFELFENGALKPISNFYEVEGRAATQVAVIPATPNAAVPAPPPPPKEEIAEHMRRRIIFYIDNLSLAPFNRNRVFTQMKDFAKNVMRPGDEAMIATFNRSMKIRATFTRDPRQIAQTLDVIAGESALGLSNRSEKRDVEGRIRDAQSYDEGLASARTYASSVEHDLRQSVDSINGLMTTLAGVEGKKILVLTTEGFQIQPGREMFYMLDETAKEKGWSAGGSGILESMSFDGNTYIQSVARTANANAITLYALHAGGLGAANEGNNAENAKPVSFSVSQAAVSNSTDSLQLLAELTGGLAAINTNNYAKAFKNIERDLDSYYSLGYRGGTERVDRQRSLQVRVKNRSLRVRNRQTFVEKSTFAEMNDRVIANLLYRSKANDLKIAVKINTPLAADEMFRVPIEVQVPMDNLTLLPQGEAYLGGFTVYVGVANKEGDMSDVSHRTTTIRVPKEDFEKTKGKYYTYVLDLVMEPGVNKVSVGVIDDVSNVTGFDRQQVIAQDLR